MNESEVQERVCSSMLEVIKLRCEYKENPIGIDVKVPRLSWQLKSDDRGILQEAYHIQVCSGDDTFTDIEWDTGRVNSDQSVHIPYKGQILKSRERYYYRVRVWDNMGNASAWSDAASWEMGFMSAEEWTADWITPALGGEESSENCPFLRNNFTVAGSVKKARIYATALGLYELQLNGARVGDCLFTPGWTNYNKRLQYQTYDVTDMLKEGDNVIGAILGHGWYIGNLTWTGKKGIYGDKAALLMQMHITYENGKEVVYTSDKGWKSSTGPILMSEIYHGETYDARLEKEGWSTPGYSDEDWNGVGLLEHSKNILVAQENVPVRAIKEIKPIEILKTPKAETVIDFGQNMVGWVKFCIDIPAGNEVILQHAEVLDKEGNFYTENLRTAKQTNKYISKGTGKETFEPHFTFQGFRYIKIEGYLGELSKDNFTGIVIHSDMEDTGSFKCSNDLVNKLQENIKWGQRGNFLDIPTDCPQRNERLGWTGDAQMFIRTACFNMGVAPFFTKWLRDLYSEQSEDNGVPSVIPHILSETDNSSAAWGDAAVICPWTIYLCYGDTRILEEQYESMKLWVEYIRKQGEEEYLWNTGVHYGDWLGLDSKPGSYKGATSIDFICTAFYAYSTDLLRKTAKVLKKDEEAAKYDNLYDNIIKSFRKEFVSPNGRLVSPTQTAHVLALMFNLVEEKDRKRIADSLVILLNTKDKRMTIGYATKPAEEKDYTLATGFVGTPYLCHVLSENGYNDVAYQLLLRTEYPSWLYPITKGATTIWEHWDGIKEDGTFWSKDMNSFNHYAYGAIGDWLYRKVAGINIDEQNPGYKHIVISPKPDSGLTFSDAKLQTMYGEIVSFWGKNQGELKVNFDIPANTNATVVLPEAVLAGLKESGEKLDSVGGVYSAEQTPEGVKLELGSGSYKFSYNL